MIYFDNASSTELNRNIKNKLDKYYNNYANTTSIHELGKKSKRILENSRKNIANILNITDKKLIFTSSATEANNTVIKSLCYNNKTEKREILTSKLEHSSVIRPIESLVNMGYVVRYIKVKENGQIDIEDLKSKISKNTYLISIMSVNNETGVINDIDSIGEIVYQATQKYGKIYYHSDITQSLLKVSYTYKHIDFLTGTFYKLHSVKGVGFIATNHNLQPLLEGGKQENGMRASTVNTELIHITSDALSEYSNELENIENHFKTLKQYFLEKCKKYNIQVNGTVKEAVNNIINISINNKKNEFIQTYLDMNDIYVSTGSACNSNIVLESEVLKAMGLDIDRINTSIRISFGIYNTKEEIDIFFKILEKVLI